jgi:hypothetical protein
MAGADDPKTFRVFLLGAGFSRAAGMPLTSEFVPLIKRAALEYMSDGKGYTHLANALDRYQQYVDDVDPGRPFDLEQFGAWIDWAHTLWLRGSDTFHEQGNEDGLQLRWAIGKVLYDAMPDPIPELYLEFATRLNTSDRVLTLNYDVLLERALDEVGLPYRRFPQRYSDVYEMGATVDNDQDELVVSKLHGSLDWALFTGREYDPYYRLEPLVEGPRDEDDPLVRIGTMRESYLWQYYSSHSTWWAIPPLLLPPSTAKPLARSELIPLWNGAGLYAYMYGGFTVIGCSLPPGDPYVVQLVHHIATDYASGRSHKESVPWPQRRMKVVDLCTDDGARERCHERYRFFEPNHTDFILEGFNESTLDAIFDDAV